MYVHAYTVMYIHVRACTGVIIVYTSADHSIEIILGSAVRNIFNVLQVTRAKIVLGRGIYGNCASLKYLH